MAKITVEVQPNGYIRIDVPSEVARETGATPYVGGRADQMAEDIARAVSSHGTIEAKWFRMKRGLSNAGWTATYLDPHKQVEYVAEQERQTKAAMSRFGIANPHMNGECGINSAHSDEDHSDAGR